MRCCVTLRCAIISIIHTINQHLAVRCSKINRQGVASSFDINRPSTSFFVTWSKIICHCREPSHVSKISIYLRNPRHETRLLWHFFVKFVLGNLTLTHCYAITYLTCSNFRSTRRNIVCVSNVCARLSKRKKCWVRRKKTLVTSIFIILRTANVDVTKYTAPSMQSCYGCWMTGVCRDCFLTTNIYNWVTPKQKGYMYKCKLYQASHHIYTINLFCLTAHLIWSWMVLSHTKMDQRQEVSNRHVRDQHRLPFSAL